MTEAGKFESLVDRAPFSKERLIGWAVSWFLKRQDPEKIEMTSYKNGYEVSVYTDEDGVGEAVDFWEEYVKPHLGDSE